MKTREDLEELTRRLITNETIIKLIDVVFNNAPHEFFTEPASGSGTHHPLHTRAWGGLVEHTILVVKYIDIITTLIKTDKDTREGLIAAAILHDICKNGRPQGWGSRMVPEHGTIAKNFIMELVIENSLDRHIAEDISYLISKHFQPWLWDGDKTIESISEPYQILILADYLAAHMWKGNEEFISLKT